MPFTSSGWHIVNARVASVIISECLRYAMIVIAQVFGKPMDEVFQWEAER